MHGVFIESGPSDWQIIQQSHGFGAIRLSGTFRVPVAAQEVGVEVAYPVIRIMSEEDNSQILPWTKAISKPSEDGYSGTWSITLSIPAGGLYRIETGLDTISTTPKLGWIFRGDVRLHLGVGDIFIIAGQSNSSGYGRDCAFDPPDINVHLYRNRGTWDMACHPMNESTFAADHINSEMGISGTSPYLSFGKVLHKMSRYPIGLVTCALGGSPISRWDINKKGDLFYNMIDRIKDCGNHAAGILWYQGCSDSTPPQSKEYYDNFERLVNETRKELGYEIPFFTFQLNRQVNAEYNEDWGILREAQRQASCNLSKVYILPTLHSSLCDGIHNNSHSSMMLGENMAKLCGNILYLAPVHFAPNIIAADYQSDIVRITFSNMKKGFILVNGNPQQCGFLMKDSTGTIPILSLRAVKDSPVIEFVISRIPSSDILISFGWEADPSHIALYDEVSFMPPLCFYEFPIQQALVE